MAQRALLVGLNRYPDPANNLRGCVNDVLQVSNLLRRRFGFDPSRDIRLLTDERATTGRIVERLDWLVAGASPGDVLVFHYSGHGLQVRDRHGDELDDGLDEIICPYDLNWDDPFTDDDLGQALAPVPDGVNITVLLDCCHAGTGLREATSGLPIRAKHLFAPPDVRHRASASIRDCGPDRRLTLDQAPADLLLRRFGSRAAARGAILVAGCRSDQTSADGWFDGDFRGALTYCFCKAVDEGDGRVTYREAVSRARRLVKEMKLEQVPQLECAPVLASQQVFGPFSRQIAA